MTENLAPIVAQMGIVFDTPEDIVHALQAYAIEILEDQEIKIYLTVEEIAEHEHEARKLTAKVMRLEQLAKDFSEYIKKGSIKDAHNKIGQYIQAIQDQDVLSNTEGYSFHPPLLGGIGTNALKEQIKHHVNLAEKGHITEKGEVYGVVNEKAKTIEYVTAQGKPAGIPARPMTAGQLRNYSPQN